MNIGWQKAHAVKPYCEWHMLLWGDRCLGELKLIDGEGWFHVDSQGKHHYMTYGLDDAKRWLYVAVARELTAVVDHLLNHAEEMEEPK